MPCNRTFCLFSSSSSGFRLINKSFVFHFLWFRSQLRQHAAWIGEQISFSIRTEKQWNHVNCCTNDRTGDFVNWKITLISFILKMKFLPSNYTAHQWSRHTGKGFYQCNRSSIEMKLKIKTNIRIKFIFTLFLCANANAADVSVSCLHRTTFIRKLNM